MIPRADILQTVVADLRMSAAFVTILPVASSTPAGDGAVARASWALPVAGLVVGLAGAMVYAVASRFGLTPTLAALLALATTALLTGALHEDGLADTADGLGGGRTRARKLEIMRDSRIGTYGVCALICSFGLRWSALATVANPTAVALALCAAHAAARAGLPAFMALVPPARADGLSASVGAPPSRSIAIALVIGALALLLALGPGKALAALVLVALAGLLMARLAIRQIGGQTGDILGAFEQMSEILVLLVAASIGTGG